MTLKFQLRSLTACLIAGALLGACGTLQQNAAYQVTDSAGIRILTNARPSWSQESAWAVDSAPLVVFGRGTDDSVSMLLHPIGAVRLSDGRVVVGDRGSDNLKLFLPTGAFQRSIGREGDGPGEFRYIARLLACHADSLFADDIAHHVISVVAPDGTVGRTFVLRTPEPGQPPYEISCNRQGDFLTSGWGSMASRGEPYRPQVPVSLATPDGEVHATLGQFPGTEMMPTFGGAGPRRMGRWLRLAMSRQFAWVAPNDNADLFAFDPAGGLRVIVRTSGIDRPVTPADLEWHRQAALDSAQTARAAAEVRRELDAMIAPRTMPPLVRLLADSDDYLWVQRYPDPGQSHGRWDIYRPDGVLLGAVTMPRALFPVEIGADYVLGLATGEDGSQWVQLHRLHRAGFRARGT